MVIHSRLLVFCHVLLFSGAVQSAEWIAEGGLHFGGDTIVTVNGSDGSSDSLRAGEELSVAAGGAFSISETMQFMVTFGMKKEVVYPDDGAITFTRFPLDMLLLYPSGRWRYGAGLTAHMNPVYKEDRDSSKQTVEFKNAIGGLLDVRYFFLDELYVAGRITIIRYVIENDPANTGYNGSSLGGLVGFQF